MLRLVDHLFTHTVRLQIGDDEKKEANVKAVLKDLGIDISADKKIRKTKTDITKKKMAKISFQGRACKSILKKKQAAIGKLNGYEQIIGAMAYPTRGEITATVARKLWQALEEMIDKLAEQWDDEHDMYDRGEEKQGLRDEHAETLRASATSYVNLIVHYFGNDAVTLYMHVCAMHVPTLIRSVGSLQRWSMQALEHCHSLRKKNRRLACNHKKKGAKTRGEGTVGVCYMATELTRQEALSRAHTDLAERPKKHYKSAFI